MLSKLKKLNLRPKKSQTAGEDYIVALDIGTEYVKALIGKIRQNDTIEIIGVGRQHQELSDMQAGAISDIGRVVGNCDQALAAAEAMAGVTARKAIVGIAGELVKGTTTTVRVSRKNPEKEMDIAEVEQIISLVQERSLERAKKTVATELGGRDVGVKLVSSALVSIEIDDYKVTNPVGFKGKLIVVRLYTAFAPMIHIGALERTVKELDLDLLAVAAEPFAVARSVVGNNQKSNTNAVLMDVGGGTTDIALLADGGVQGTTMFGIGGRAFTRGIERDLDCSFSEAEDLKLQIGGTGLSIIEVNNIKSSIDKTMKVWIDGVGLALDSFDTVDQLPYKLLLCGGGSSLEMLMTELEKSLWYDQLPFTKKPVVQHISPSQVVDIVDTTHEIKDHTYITAMGLLRIGLDTIQVKAVSSPGTGIKARINRILSI